MQLLKGNASNQNVKEIIKLSTVVNVVCDSLKKKSSKQLQRAGEMAQ